MKHGRLLSLLAVLSLCVAFAAWWNPQPAPDAPEAITYGMPRSPRWPTVRKHYLAAHPTCAACGVTAELEVHHAKPFHLYPHLELDPENLIVLCRKNGCHFRGHCLDWRAYDPNVREWAAGELKRIKGRRYQ